ncbi:MAG: hypothetical protein OEZ59_06735 [Deltaproteobacteria bacterium]|nr:hypothetical protein [Deltaproteobacteria bacterium]
MALALLMVSALILWGCGEDGGDKQADSGITALPFTEGDGIPELTGVPIMPVRLDTQDVKFTVSIPADSDTVSVSASLTSEYDQYLGYGSALVDPVTGLATIEINITYAVQTIFEGTKYALKGITACDADLGTGCTQEMQYTWIFQNDTYSFKLIPDGNPTATQVITPTILATIAEQADTLPYVDVNPMKEMTGLPVLPATLASGEVVSVPVDADTEGVYVRICMVNTEPGNEGCNIINLEGYASVTPGTAHTVGVSLTGTNPGTGSYSLVVITCKDNVTLCNLTNLGAQDPNTGSYFYYTPKVDQGRFERIAYEDFSSRAVTSLAYPVVEVP